MLTISLARSSTFQQQGTSAVHDKNRSQTPINNSCNRSAERRTRSTLNHTTPQVTYQPVPSSGASGLPELQLTEFSGDPLEWPEWLGVFDDVVHQNAMSNREKMQYMKTSRSCQAKAGISGIEFSSLSWHLAWDKLCEKYGRSDVIVNAQFKKTHIPIIRFGPTILWALSNLELGLQMWWTPWHNIDTHQTKKQKQKF